MANPQSSPKSSCCSWLKFLQYREGEVSASDARTVLLVIATLIAAVTFQAGVNPPGGVWQDNKDGHKAGSSIYAYDGNGGAYFIFLISNTLAFSTSILVIMSLTYKFPLCKEIWIATGLMMITYASSLFAVKPSNDSGTFRYTLLAAVVPFGVRFVIQFFKEEE